MRSTRVLALLAALPFSLAYAQRDPAVVERLIDLGKNHNQAPEILKTITKKIGARRTGSQAIFKGQQWAMAQLRKWGWRNVHLEQWGTVPVGFERGRNYAGGVVAPFHWNMTFSSAAWTPGTNGPRRALAAMQPATMAEFEKQKENLKGRWIVMRTLQGMRGSRPVPPMSAEDRAKDPAAAQLEDVEKALDKLGIAGKVFGESEKRNWVHTHGTWQGVSMEHLPTDVRVNISYSDHRLLRTRLEAKEAIQLEFNVDQKFIPGEVPVYNVVAEWPGTDKKDEWVVFGAHFDSWDGPGSEGASDNGTGSTTELEAARLLSVAQAKPRRSLRIVLFSGEEQGLLGSAFDAKQLLAKRMKVAVMLNEDSGSNYHNSLSGLPEWKPLIESAMADTNRAFPDHQVHYSAGGSTWPRGAGSDHASYLDQGIPAFSWGKDGPQQYGFIWHTQNDTFENAFLPGVVQMSTNHALMIYNFACADDMLWRPPVWPIPPSDQPATKSVGFSDDED